MPFRKPCLFVAPDTNLYYARVEAETVVNLLHANLLSGKVEIGDLIERVRSVQPQLLIVSTHGSPDGILLSDGYAGADLLKPILSTTPVECMYLNTCESLETAMAIHNELPTALVATIQPVPDKTAYVTMTAFAYHLERGLSYVDAWYRSKAAGNRNFLFLPSAAGGGLPAQAGPAAPPQMSQAILRPPERNGNGEIQNLHEEVERLAIVMYGDDKWNVEGVLPRLAKIERNTQRILTLLGLLFLLGCLLLVALGVVWRVA